jgi:hypothetical protein
MTKAQAKTIPKGKIQDEAKSNGDLNKKQGTALERKIFDLPTYKKDGTRESVNGKNPYVVLKYFQNEFECFSDWTTDELKLFSKFLNNFSSYTWDSVYKSSGKGKNKAGIGYTPYDTAKMKSGQNILDKVKKLISPDIGFFELRVSDKIRLHGFQSQSAFFLVLLDREHRVFT